MSFLNQLKTQANALQAQRTAQDQELDERVQQVEVACRTVLYYLQDLARQLTVIEPPAPAFTVDGKTPWPAMKLVDFRTDARRKRLRDREVYDYVAMGWRVVPQVGDPLLGMVSVNFPTDQKRVEDRLAMGPVEHQRHEVRHPVKNTLQEVRYEYWTHTRGSVVLTPDHDQSQLRFRLLNTAGFEVLHSNWPAARVDSQALDELAKRIVAQPNRFA